jgi:hypothetical protein
MSTMDISHIRNILQSLTKNHITVPIITNRFEETCAMDVYSQVTTNEYEDFDDFDKECTSAHLIQSSAPIPSTQQVVIEKPSAIRSLLQCLSIVQNETQQTTQTAQTLQESSKIEMMQLLFNLKEFLSKTLLKDLEITKMKLTKKKLKEDIDVIYKNVDSNNNIQGFQENVKGMLVVASRYMHKEIHVQGDLLIDIPHKSSEVDSGVINIDCSNNCFTLVQKL